MGGWERYLGNEEMVASDHLHLHPKLTGVVNSSLGVGTRRVEEGQEAGHLWVGGWVGGWVEEKKAV